MGRYELRCVLRDADCIYAPAESMAWNAKTSHAHSNPP